MPQGPIYGRKTIEKHYADVFQKVHFSNHLVTLDQNSPHIIGTAGNEMWATGEWSATNSRPELRSCRSQGLLVRIDVREGDDWKMRMLTWNDNPSTGRLLRRNRWKRRAAEQPSYLICAVTERPNGGVVQLPRGHHCQMIYWVFPV